MAAARPTNVRVKGVAKTTSIDTYIGHVLRVLVGVYVKVAISDEA
jgi:hypothetical protein